MLKRLCALLCALLLPAYALADIAWPAAAAPGQSQLIDYISRVNANQGAQTGSMVNSLFEFFPGFAVLGATVEDMAEVPENVEMTFTMSPSGLNTMQLRCSYPEQFATLAASCIQAASPVSMTLADAAEAVTAYQKKVTSAPAASFEDTIDLLQGEKPRVYFAYYPNQYRDGVNWLQMTLIFPLPGFGDTALMVTPAPYAGESEAYDGSDYDGFTHFEIFVTPTPEPDM